MNLKLLVCPTLMLACSAISAQSLEWVKSFGGSGADFCHSITLDASGNVLTAGRFHNTVDFDPGPGTSVFTSAGDQDNFIQKLDPNGNFVWALAFGGIDSDRINTVLTDVSGNVFATGHVYGEVDIDPGPGISLAENVFVLKLDSGGNVMWVKSFPELSGIALALDSSGNIYVKSVSGSNSAVSLRKLDASGNVLWMTHLADALSWHNARSLAVDASDNVYLLGHFYDTMDADPGAGVYNLTSAGYSDIFIQKLDADGNFVWAKAFGGSYLDEGNALVTDASGSVYVTGDFRLTADFDPSTATFNLTSVGERDAFVLKLDSGGNFQWAKSFGGISKDTGYSIALDAEGSVFTTGHFYSEADFDPGAGTHILTPTDSPSAFVQKLDSNGNFLWSQTFASNGNAIDAIANASGDIFIAGAFSGTGDFDPEDGVTNLVSAGSSDAFIIKLTAAPMSVGDVQGNIGVKAYPNPSNGKVNIALDNELSGVEMTLADTQGRIVFAKSFAVFSNADIDLPFSPGIYVLTLKTQFGQICKKLVRQ